MQITRAEVIPIELQLKQPARMANLPEVQSTVAIFVRIETQQGHNAWGCTVAHPDLTGETPQTVIEACRACADLVPDLHPTNLEFSLSQLASAAGESDAAMCAFDLAFHDLLGLAAGLPLYRLLGGYRNRIQTSVTIPLGSVREGVKTARQRARHGFRMLKIKGGLDPEEDVRRVRAIYRALPDVVIRLDADGGYQVAEALDVARALEGRLEMLEQPTPVGDLEDLCRVTELSPVPVLADQCVSGPASALALAAKRHADGLSVKVATCGGLRGARQVDAIARAARMATMVSCVIEPALLTAAGLSLALSSPNVQYGDLDGFFDLVNDPTQPGFRVEEGWLVASDVPGLGCLVDLD
jgi:L-alanine-DL-glutamate epimerase-like enolase superfamily enzyme